MNAGGGTDLDSGDLASWLNCECFFSLVLVGLLAALPFNLPTQELMQSPETYVNRAIEFSNDGAFDKVLAVEIGIQLWLTCRCRQPHECKI